MDRSDHPIIKQETELLERIIRRLADLVSEGDAVIDFDATLLDLRDQLVEAKPEDVAPLVEQMTRLQGLAQTRGASQTQGIDIRSPYFGHLQLEDERGRRDVLIGKRGYVDTTSGVRIVDWRTAPISRLYYCFEEGDDYHEQFGSTPLEGEILARRTVSIRNRRLMRIMCPQGIFVRRDGSWSHQPIKSAILAGGEGQAERAGMSGGHWKQRLGLGDNVALREDKRLPQIAALLDSTQFALITRYEAGVFLLRGGAGSGKTTVALHRIAYLHFQNPKRFRTAHMLVVVLNRPLVDYIKRLLPELDVHGVRVSTLDNWALGLRNILLPEFKRPAAQDTPQMVERIKRHPAMLHVLNTYAENKQTVVKRSIRELAEATGAPWLVPAWDAMQKKALVPRLEAVNAAYRRNYRGCKAAERLQIEQTLARLMDEAKDIVSDWAEVITNGELLQEGLRIAPDHAVRLQDIDGFVRYTSRQIDEPLDLSFVDEEYHTGVDGEALGTTTGMIDACDNPLFLRLFQLAHGALVTPEGPTVGYDHIVMDEAQDFSAVELRVLHDATRGGTVTLAGDMAQKISSSTGLYTWEEMMHWSGISVNNDEVLIIGYRSTREIYTLAQAILGDLPRDAVFTPTRSGAPVQHFGFEAAGQAVAFLGEALRDVMSRERLASIAVLAPTPALARMYHDGLVRSEVPSLRLVLDGQFLFKPGVDVTEVEQVKGLEYDYVVVVEVNREHYPETIEARHLLHIAVTRAAHQLWLLSTGTPSPLLPNELLEPTK